jgi:hypothetical protein
MINHIKRSFKEAVEGCFHLKYIKLNLLGKVFIYPFLGIFFPVAFFLELGCDHKAEDKAISDA